MIPSHTGAELSWAEPWFFKLRTSSRAAWIARGSVFVAIYVFFAILLRMENGASNGPSFGIAEKLLLPALIGAVFLAMFEAVAERLHALGVDVELSDWRLVAVAPVVDPAAK